MRTTWDRQSPDELIYRSIDFGAALAEGAVIRTITSVTAACGPRHQGRDPDPAAIISVAPQLDATETIVTFGVSGGVSGVEYVITAEVECSNGEVLTSDHMLRIVAPKLGSL